MRTREEGVKQGEGGVGEEKAWWGADGMRREKRCRAARVGKQGNNLSAGAEKGFVETTLLQGLEITGHGDSISKEVVQTACPLALRRARYDFLLLVSFRVRLRASAH